MTTSSNTHLLSSDDGAIFDFFYFFFISLSNEYFSLQETKPTEEGDKGKLNSSDSSLIFFFGLTEDCGNPALVFGFFLCVQRFLQIL